MKKILLVSFVVYFISCSSGNVVFVADLNKRVKVFKNDTFQFYYPKKWVKFDEGETFQKKAIISIAPKKKIYNSYSIKKKIYGKNRKINLSEKDKKSYPDTDFDKALKGKDAWAKIKINLNKNILIDEIVTSYTSKNINSSMYKNFELSKINNDFYIISYRKSGRKRESNYSFGDFIYKVYLRQKGDDVYQIVYSAGQYSYSDYEDEASMILRSFKFLDEIE